MYDVPETITRLNPSTGLYETIPVPTKTTDEVKKVVQTSTPVLKCNEAKTIVTNKKVPK